MATKQSAKKVVRRRRERKNIERGAVHIQSTFNNTIVTITDTQTGSTAISWASAGEMGFRKNPPRSLHRPLRKNRCAAAMNMPENRNYVKGPGSGREAAIRALQGVGLEVTLIKDVTPIPHNGCRPPKRRRV